ncbi:MAG TPA: DUF4157 domain-containing protein, partial [Tahibacter sp.]|nr:DUF4157 domain-containing protein [Tahibacter sp.]
LAHGGMPLDAHVRGDMEARFGHDFSHVRTHTDAAAARSAHEIGALAYTAGHHVVFGDGRYRPATADGRRLIAHELTHVLQQTPGVVRRAPAKKAPAPKTPTAADAPKLDYRPAKNPKPCACLVFIHHDETNAHAIATNLYEHCRYNLAMIKPRGGSRMVKLPAHAKAEDPNGMFPRRVAEQCWRDDKPCRQVLVDKAGATDEAGVREYVENQFFIALKDCSDGFRLPIVGLHNNSIDDTQSYRDDLAKKTGAPDLTKIENKTFDKGLTTATATPDRRPYDELKQWADLLTGVKENTTTKRLQGGPFQLQKTNIFIWCQAKDNTKCHIGAPTHPDNVVWVTNEADFDTLRGTKTNVALQTVIDPSGDSATDLSSLFVTLSDVVGLYYATKDKATQARIAAAVTKIAGLRSQLTALSALGTRAPLVDVLKLQLQLQITLEDIAADAARNTQLKDTAEHKRIDAERRFVNIETPPKELLGEAGLVDSLKTVRGTLASLKLDCCDSKPSSSQDLEDAVKAAAKKPPPPKKKKKTKPKGKGP